jgi:hydrogenase/urease accessory protein HupE
MHRSKIILPLGRWRPAIRFIPLLLALLAMVLPTAAHEPGLSTGVIRLTPDTAFSQLTFAWRDVHVLTPLDANDDGELTTNELAAAKAKLDELAATSLEIRADETLLKVGTFRAFVDETNNVHFETEFPLRAPDRLTIFSPLIDQMPRGHRQFVILQDETTAPLAEVLLSAEQDVIEMDLHALFPPTTFTDFFKLGLEHIITGYDHLLFLFGLLLVTMRFRTAAIIITCFTLAHSLTLALATLDIVNLRSRVVEPLIAVTIICVGVENLFFRDGPKWRWALTFGFGLIHGLGFASILKELGVSSGTTGITVPLLSFNLGVEAGQLAIAVVALPILFALRRWQPFARWGVIAGSLLVALLGLWWFWERTVF